MSSFADTEQIRNSLSREFRELQESISRPYGRLPE